MKDENPSENNHEIILDFSYLLENLQVDRIIFLLRFFIKNFTYDIPVSEYFYEDYKDKYRGLTKWTDEFFQEYIDDLLLHMVKPKDKVVVTQKNEKYEYYELDMQNYYESLGDRKEWLEKKSTQKIKAENWVQAVDEGWLSIPPSIRNISSFHRINQPCWVHSSNKIAIIDGNFDHARIFSEMLYRYFPSSDYYWSEKDTVEVPAVGNATMEIARVIFSVDMPNNELIERLKNKFSENTVKRSTIGKLNPIYNGENSIDEDMVLVEEGIYVCQPKLDQDRGFRIQVWVTEEYPGILQMEEHGLMRFCIGTFVKLYKLVAEQNDKFDEVVQEFIDFVERDFTVSNWDKQLLIKMLSDYNKSGNRN